MKLFINRIVERWIHRWAQKRPVVLAANFKSIAARDSRCTNVFRERRAKSTIHPRALFSPSLLSFAFATFSLCPSHGDKLPRAAREKTATVTDSFSGWNWLRQFHSSPLTHFCQAALPDRKIIVWNEAWLLSSPLKTTQYLGIDSSTLENTTDALSLERNVPVNWDLQLLWFVSLMQVM